MGTIGAMGMAEAAPHYCVGGYVADSQQDLDDHVVTAREGEHREGR